MAEACVICTCALLIKISYYDYSLHLLKQIVRSSNTFQCNFGHIFKCNWCDVCYMLAILILPATILFSIAILLCAMRSLLKKGWLYYKRFRKPFPDTFYGLITFLLTGIECIYFLMYISSWEHLFLKARYLWQAWNFSETRNKLQLFLYISLLKLSCQDHKNIYNKYSRIPTFNIS